MDKRLGRLRVRLGLRGKKEEPRGKHEEPLANGKLQAAWQISNSTGAALWVGTARHSQQIMAVRIDRICEGRDEGRDGNPATTVPPKERGECQACLN